MAERSEAMGCGPFEPRLCQRESIPRYFIRTGQSHCRCLGSMLWGSDAPGYVNGKLSAGNCSPELPANIVGVWDRCVRASRTGQVTVKCLWGKIGKVIGR